MTHIGEVFSDGSPFRIGRDSDWDTNILDVPEGMWSIDVDYASDGTVRTIRLERIL